MEISSIDRVKLIKIVEGKLSPYGFRYKEYKNLCWTFSREINEVDQYVIIQASSNRMGFYLSIYTSVFPIQRLNQFADDPKYKYDLLSYSNEQEFEKILDEIGDIIIKYGIPVLNKNSDIKNNYFYVTAEMHERLYQDRKLLQQNFMKRHGDVNLSDEDILSLIKKELDGINNCDDKALVEVILELAAVMGGLIIKNIGGEWELNRENEQTGIGKIPLIVYFPVLQKMSREYLQNGGDYLLQDYNKYMTIFNDWVQKVRAEYGNEWTPPKRDIKIEAEEMEYPIWLSNSIRKTFQNFLNEGKTVHESKILLANEYIDVLDEEDGFIFWFTLSGLLLERGELSQQEKEYTLSWLNKIEDIKKWKMDYPDLDLIRKKITDEFD